MRRIAHLSDVHILDARTSSSTSRYRFATKLVSLGRKVDPLLRSRRLARALEAAKASGADHIVISGDLTEVGEDVEFEHFAEILHNAKLPEDSVTLVPGNHDAYTAANAWTRAMNGPLARFAKASAHTHMPGKIVDRGPVVFLPIDTSCFQTMARSSGEFTKATAEAVERRVSDPGLRDKALVLVLHHPPFHPHRVLKWIDGLRGCAEVLDLLARHPRLQLLHGHLHRVMDRILATSQTARGIVTTSTTSGSAALPTRLFGAPATCDGTDEAPRFRLYDVVDGAVRAA
jgi:Icc protein